MTMADKLLMKRDIGRQESNRSIGNLASICFEADCSVGEGEGQRVPCERPAAWSYSVLFEENSYPGFTDEENETFTGADASTAEK